MKIKSAIFRKIHLIISIVIVIPAAFIYGFKPELILNISLVSVDENNFNKGVMGVYLGFSILWLLGIFKKGYLKTAQISNIIFMMGLAFGRILSMLTDGLPTILYIIGAFGELVLGCYGLWVFKWQQFSKKA